MLDGLSHSAGPNSWRWLADVGLRSALVAIAVVALGSRLATADLVEADWQGLNDRLLTVDTETGLSWLDLTASINRSVNNVQAQFGPGGEFEGFRHATADEVATFWTNAGLSSFSTAVNTTAGSTDPAEVAAALVLQMLWGVTLVLPGSDHSQGFIGEGPSAGSFHISIVGLFPASGPLVAAGTRGSTADSSFVSPDVGHALVTSAEGSGFAITIDSLSNSSTADFTDGSGSVRSFRRTSGPVVTSSSITPVANVLCAMRSFSTHYRAGLGADSDTSNTDASSFLLSDYLVRFTVHDPSNLGYQLEISTQRIGAATVHNDSSSGNADVSVGAVTGALNAVNNPDLGLPLGANLVSVQSSTSVGFDQANQLIISDVGTKVFDLEFSWTSQVRSDSVSFFGSGDGGAVRMGIGNIIGNTQADNYPGFGSRNIDDDGHFLDVKATLGGPPYPDSDGDGIPDFEDNCTEVPNADQRDTNSDGYGNLCAPDLNNDGRVDFLDLGRLKSVFFTSDPDADLNGDDSVDFLDLGLMKSGFFGPPGPSGLPCAGTVPCYVDFLDLGITNSYLRGGSARWTRDGVRVRTN